MLAGFCDGSLALWLNNTEGQPNATEVVKYLPAQPVHWAGECNQKQPESKQANSADGSTEHTPSNGEGP